MTASASTAAGAERSRRRTADAARTRSLTGLLALGMLGLAHPAGATTIASPLPALAAATAGSQQRPGQTPRAASPTGACAPRSSAPRRSSGSRAAPAKPPGEAAREIRTLEELGAYGQAAEALGALRRQVPPDPDLDLALALNLARSGQVDSAARLLGSPTLSAALHDTTDTRRFQTYGWRHERVYFGGRFDGWFWYVARARAEVEARRGDWNAALEAARVCTRARPCAGVEWYLRALCAGRAGERDESRDAATRALTLSPVLPEAQYLYGLLEWKAGRRAAAQDHFRAAIGLDSLYRAPALALVRARLPVPPDTLPNQFFAGLREAALLTSRTQPKYDEFEQMDVSANAVTSPELVVPDSLKPNLKPMTLTCIVLVDDGGRIVMNEDHWIAAGTLPDELVGMISALLREWRFTPAIRLGRPTPLWAEVQVSVKP